MKGRRKVRTVGQLFALMFLANSLAACTTQTITPRRDLSVGPALSVESFLRAVNEQDLEQMARLFGTADGPISDTGSAFGCMFKKMGSWIGLGDSCLNRQDIELRMNAIAMMLRHDDYRLGADQRVAGRENLTTQIPVDLTRDGRRFAGVPFTVVQTGSGGWLVEQIGLERVMGE